MGASSSKVVQIPRWLPAAQAAQALGVAERTLRHRAAHGSIQRRRDGRQVLYLVTSAVTPATVTPNTRPATLAEPAAIAALAGELAAALERAVRAELERDGARALVAQLEAERDAARAAGVDLAARLVKRGRILRELAARLAP